MICRHQLYRILLDIVIIIILCLLITDKCIWKEIRCLALLGLIIFIIFLALMIIFGQTGAHRCD